MKYLLDTNTCIVLIRQKSPRVLKHLASCTVGNVGISSITLAELEVGVAKSNQPVRGRAALDNFIIPLEVMPFNAAAARAYGAVRAHLEMAGTPIGSLDTLIGAHALALGVTVVTNNVREFDRIPGLTVADWTKG